MKRMLPLMAALAATLAAPLATPLAAQDISSVLNPGNFAARLGVSGTPAMADLPTDMSDLFMAPIAAARINPAMASQIAALAPVTAPEIRSLAPRTSIAPTPRGSIARVTIPAQAATPITTVPAPGGDLIAMMADVSVAAPAGANTLVINGTTTAHVASGSLAEAPRRSLWQRLFGG